MAPSSTATSFRHALACTAPSSTETDLGFILSAFDSSLPFLSSIGSGAQWGSVPFSSKPQTVAQFHDFIADAHAALASEHEAGNEPTQRRKTMHIALRSGIRVGACATTHASLPEYLPASLQSLVSQKCAEGEEAEAEAERWLYINYLVSHRQRESRGVGGELIAHVCRCAKEQGVRWIWVDCWSGNRGGLVRFYEKNGFRTVGDPFHVPGKHGDGLPWTGRLLCLDLEGGTLE
ncbi:hypothetical protein ACQY0O_005654 [Thecaphora frezii]